MHKCCQECHNQKYCKGISQLKELLRSETINLLSGSVTIERTVRECRVKSISRKCNNQMYCQEVLQVKLKPGSATIKGTARECHKQNASIISTYRECRDQKYIQGVHIKNSARECHKQKYCQRLSHEKVLPRSATIQNTSRECHNQKY